MITNKLVAKRSIKTPGGKVYGAGDIVPIEELHEPGIPMLIMAGHVVEVFKDEPEEVTKPVKKVEPEIETPVDPEIEEIEEDEPANSREDIGYDKKAKIKTKAKTKGKKTR